MNPVEIAWEFVSSRFQETDFWPPIVTGAIIVSGTFLLCRQLKQWRYRLEIILFAVGLVLAEFNLFMKWNYILLYLLAGTFLLSSLVLFLVPFFWNKCRLARIRKLCRQQFFVEAFESLNGIKSGWLTASGIKSLFTE